MAQETKNHLVTASISTVVSIAIAFGAWGIAYGRSQAQMEAKIKANTDFREQGQRFTKTDGQRLEDKIDEVIFLLKK